MLKRLLAVLILTLGLVAPASADLLPLPYTMIATSTTFVVLPQPGIFFGVATWTVQVSALSCYDNASAASGVLVFNNTLGVVGFNSNAYPSTGLRLRNGLTCIASGVPLGNGYMVLAQ